MQKNDLTISQLNGVTDTDYSLLCYYNFYPHWTRVIVNHAEIGFA